MALPFVKEHVRQTRERAQRNLLCALQDLQIASGLAIDLVRYEHRVPSVNNLPHTVGEVIRFAAMLEMCNEVQEVAEVDETPSPPREMIAPPKLDGRS